MSGPAWFLGIIAFLLAVVIVILLIERSKLKRMAYMDSMTGLLNRNALNERLFISKSDEPIAVLFLDLDHFKEINDTMGHHIGDLLIEAVGQRLMLFMNPMLHVYRIGGDEFLFIVENYEQKQVERLAEQILYSISHVYDIDGRNLHVSGSIGISIGTKKDDFLQLLKNADLAMYRAKHGGRDWYVVYTPEHS